ncbi:MAG TPA: tetratricopeptide repeat protein [Candidatus Acidoferrales bacterium]|jgi:serine/threonine protein kinase/tetratricopeptide (TPR) repeat protein|nr:tetratricopeptide repeat protein [Candidatus Acidoferrales bacterium]
MDELKPKPGRGQDAGGGLRAPAKGESSSSEVPLDNDGATFIEPPPRKEPPPPRRPPADPGATVIHPDASREGGTSVQTPSGPRSYVTSYQNVVLQVGDILGGRYEILALLGEGGMGAVYKAADREVERVVALKLIRPEMASNPAILARFKQELLTAHQVTHKNVIRIYDLAEADGVKFITMEFVEGSDLRQLLKEHGRFSPDEAVDIIRHVCMALDAAHSVGIIHRDLKPQNIMRDKAGRILVMDFGLARSVQSEGMTQTGALLGTIEYMSPEQAMGKTLDQRSDLFALGLIFYELLSGKMPFKAETAMASLLMRNQERAVPLADIDATVPAGLSDIVSRCLERDLERRYPNAAEIIADLDAWQGKRPVMASIIMQAPKPASKIPWKWVAPATAVLLLSGLFLAIPKTRHLLFPPEVAGGRARVVNTSLPALSKGKFVAVMPFRVIGDPGALGYVADGLGEALSTKLFQLKEIHVASSDEARKIDPKMATPQIAQKLGANLIVQGTVQGSADQLRITVKLENAAEDKTVLNEEFSGVPGDLLTIEDKIYAKLADALGTNGSVEQLAAGTARPTDNTDAYDSYLRGRNAMRGQLNPKTIQTAIDYFNTALRKDPKFALAYSGLADASLRMFDEDKRSIWTDKALSAAKQAQTLNDKLPEVHFSLGSVYAATGQTTQAVAEAKRALELAPNSDEAYRRLGKAYLAAGQKDQAIRALEKAVEMNPYYWVNPNELASAYYTMGDFDKAIKSYQQVTNLEPQNPIGFLNLGAAYENMGRFEESLVPLETAMKLDPQPTTISNLGTSLFYLHRYAEAAKLFEKAVELNPNDEMLMGNLADSNRAAGQMDMAKSNYDRAIGLCFKALQVNPRNSAVMGDLSLYLSKKGDPGQAMEFVQRARGLDPSSVQLMVTSAIVNTLGNRQPEAVADLKKALQHGYTTSSIESEPEFDPLRKRPDYQAMMNQFGPKKK